MRRHNKANDATDPDTGRPSPDPSGQVNRGSGRAAWAAAAAVAAVGVAAWAARDVPAELGSRYTGDRALGARGARIRESAQFSAGAFHNPIPAKMLPSGSAVRTLADMLASRGRRTPSAPVPVVTPQAPLAGDQEQGKDQLHITWYGHASTLVEIDGRRVLLDPMWSNRCSPSDLVGPKRLHPAPVDLRHLPLLDAVVISHDHYDHLDFATVRVLLRTQTAPFVVPLGVGAHLETWGVPEDRIIELDWHESAEVAGLRLTATPARHFSGRGLARDTTLWASWVVAGGTRKVFYSGDTGYFPGFAAIGAEHGPFDATLIQIGAYGPAWPDIHLTPEDGIRVHVDLHGKVMIPVHWGTFDLAVHGWSDPVNRLWLEAKARDIALAVPCPGQRVDVDNPPAVDGWWQTIS